MYLFFGLDRHTALLPWIWTSITLITLATIGLAIHQIRNNLKILPILCGMLFVEVWVEKGFGLIIPGFIPGPWGKIVAYTPTFTGVGVLLAFGLWVHLYLPYSPKQGLPLN